MNLSMFFGVRITRVSSLSFITTALSDDTAKKAFAPLASLNHLVYILAILLQRSAVSALARDAPLDRLLLY